MDTFFFKFMSFYFSMFAVGKIQNVLVLCIDREVKHVFYE